MFAFAVAYMDDCIHLLYMVQGYFSPRINQLTITSTISNVYNKASWKMYHFAAVDLP